jgi:phage FluMu protein Com
MELRMIAGWEKNSAMPEIYVHLSGEDIDRKVLLNAGLIEESEDEKKDKALEAKKCPRCKTLNAYDSKYCSTCSFVLDMQTAIKIEEQDKGLWVEFAELIKREPRLLEMLQGITQK